MERGWRKHSSTLLLFQSLWLSIFLVLPPLNYIICFNYEEEIYFKMSRIPEADSVIFVEKRAVSESTFNKWILKTPFLQNSPWIRCCFLALNFFYIYKMYFKQTQGQLWAVQMSCLISQRLWHAMKFYILKNLRMISVISWLLRCKHFKGQLMTWHYSDFDSFLIVIFFGIK